jgi:hypothetical protein
VGGGDGRDGTGAGGEYFWCRVEEEGGSVSRVNVMHPNGEILFSYPREYFEPGLVRRMQAGQVRARLSDCGRDGRQVLSFLDESDGVVYSEDVPLRSITEPHQESGGTPDS